MKTPTIRTANPDIRAQQWARTTELTYAFLKAQDETQDLRLSIAALKACQEWEWRIGEVDLALNVMLQKRIRGRLDALKASTDSLSTIQAELESLQTALDDNYEVNSHEPV